MELTREMGWPQHCLSTHRNTRRIGEQIVPSRKTRWTANHLANHGMRKGHVGRETSWSTKSQAMALGEKIGGLSDDSCKDNGLPMNQILLLVELLQ
jgi:hypothetical protein